MDIPAAIYVSDSSYDESPFLRDWKKSFEDMEKKRKAILPPSLLKLEMLAQIGHVGDFAFHYPYHHPATHYKNSITVLDDGFPMFRLYPKDKECTRFALIQYRFSLAADPSKKRISEIGLALSVFLKEKGESYLDFGMDVFKEYFRVGLHNHRVALVYLKVHRPKFVYGH